MPGYNRVVLVGNLTADLELRYTSNGTAVGDMRMAVTLKRKNGDETAFLDVTVWGTTAENCKKYLGKGSTCLIEGRITMDEWEDRQTGKKRSKLKVTADNVQFLGSPKKSGGERQGRPAPAQTANDDDFADGGEGEDVPF